MAAPKKLYIQDMHRAGTLTVVPVVSTIPRGRIKEIRIPEMPPEYGTIGRSDIPGEEELTLFEESFPLFADWEVLYQGQTIFLLYGPEEDEVFRFRDIIDIEYETDYSFLSFKGYTPEQIYREKVVKKANRKKEPETDRVVEDHFRIPHQPPLQLSRLGAFAFLEKKVLRLYGTSQWPFLHRRFISQTLGIPLKEITFRTVEGSPPADGPLWLPSLITAYTALATWITRQPCRMLLSPEEARIGSEERSAAALSFTTTLDKKGEPQSRFIDIAIDGGAYPLLSEEMLDRLCLSALGTQPLGKVEIRARIIKTSSPPLDNFNGLGMSQGFFGAELHNTHIARENRQDPLDQRKENCLEQGAPFITGGIYREKASPWELLDIVGAASDFHRKYGSYQNRTFPETELFPLNPRRGIGCSLSYQGNGFLSLADRVEKFTIAARLDTEGELTIQTSSVPGFPRTVEIWKEVAAQILQIEPEKVHLAPIDTDVVPDSGPALFSRNVTIMPRLIEQCCNSIQKKRFRAPLPIEMKRTFRLPKSSEWDREKFEGQPFLSLSWAAAAVELEINPLSCEPEIRGIWMAVNCGRILNPDYTRSLLEASVQRTLEWCTYRPLEYRQEGSFFPECVTPPRLMPFPVSIELIQNRGLPPAGIGTLADNVIPAAFAAALSQATGRPVNLLPVIPGDLILGRVE